MRPAAAAAALRADYSGGRLFLDFDLLRLQVIGTLQRAADPASAEPRTAVFLRNRTLPTDKSAFRWPASFVMTHWYYVVRDDDARA